MQYRATGQYYDGRTNPRNTTKCECKKEKIGKIYIRNRSTSDVSIRLILVTSAYLSYCCRKGFCENYVCFVFLAVLLNAFILQTNSSMPIKIADVKSFADI